ncbi:MAG: hypothetical protein WAS73_00700 [Defluviicoccus sp.]
MRAVFHRPHAWRRWQIRAHLGNGIDAGASFLTLVATPSNLMVMGPGGYRFGDYWKLGLPCMLWFFVVAVFLVPLYWRF